MAMAAARAEGQSYSDINMTPLIDVMLVLLIIFIITIPTQTHAVKIDNQTPNPNPPTSKREVIDLSIDFDGALRSPRCISPWIGPPNINSWRKPWRTCRAVG
jgi:biopolymer transport protein ExbD